MKFNGTITLDRIKCHAHHGATEQERNVGNDYEVSMTVDFPMEEAMKEDNLDATINYAHLAAIVKAEMATPSKLLENVVYRLYCAITTRYPAVTGGKITVTKLTPPMRVSLAGASVTFCW